MDGKKFSFRSCKIPNDSLTKENAIFISEEDFANLMRTTGANKHFYAKIKGKIIEIKGAKGIENGCAAMGLLFRRWLQIGNTMSDTVNFEYMYDHQPPKSVLTFVKFKVTLRDKREDTLKLEDTTLIEVIKRNYTGTPLNYGHQLFFVADLQNGDSSRFSIEADELEIDPLGPLNQDRNSKNRVNLGFLGSDTTITLASESSNLKIHSQTMTTKKLSKFDINFNDLGVGGLDEEISTIFRRAFTTRLYPPDYIEKYGIKHIKGMLLYGPPGTGKTLIARTLANALEVKEFKVVNGPELFDKYVGETEKHIRELFTQAENDEKENGAEAGLHVIVFDEIDSICRARGTINSGTGVHDGAVNQLLTKIDGVNSLNDIIVIGMTNRKDLIDEAILRPGRLELHIEIGLPDEFGRLQILKIHTKTMRDNKVLDEDVKLDELAKETRNYTGADIESLVKLATANALSEGLSFEHSKINIKEERKVCMRHFRDALKEIQPMFGTDTNELINCMKLGIINYGQNFSNICNQISSLFEQMKKSSSINLLSVLLEGEAGSGKTALAADLALKSGFPYIKIISPELLVKYLESGKYTAIYNIFEDGYKSPYSIIILDNIERLIEYIKIGPRFSNLLVQTISVFTKKVPPKKGKKMLIIGTTSMLSNIEDLGLVDGFERIIHIPNLKKDEILNVLKHYNCEGEEAEKIATLVDNTTIKNLCLLIDRTKQMAGKLDFASFSSIYTDYSYK